MTIFIIMSKLYWVIISFEKGDRVVFWLPILFVTRTCTFKHAITLLNARLIIVIFHKAEIRDYSIALILDGSKDTNSVPPNGPRQMPFCFNIQILRG